MSIMERLGDWGQPWVVAGTPSECAKALCSLAESCREGLHSTDQKASVVRLREARARAEGADATQAQIGEACCQGCRMVGSDGRKSAGVGGGQVAALIVDWVDALLGPEGLVLLSSHAPPAVATALRTKGDSRWVWRAHHCFPL